MSTIPVEQIFIATVKRNVRESVRVDLRRMQGGTWRFGLSLWFAESVDAPLAPDKGGISLPIVSLSEFANAIVAARQEARDRALIK